MRKSKDADMKAVREMWRVSVSWLFSLVREDIRYINIFEHTVSRSRKHKSGRTRSCRRAKNIVGRTQAMMIAVQRRT